MRVGLALVNNSIGSLKECLLNSHWPKCNQIADDIASYNNQDAKNALIEVISSGKRHHIRTAAIKALVNFNEVDVVEQIKKCLNDPAYETRMEAKNVLKVMTGHDYQTDKNE
jgi:hypothetical protein